MPAGKPIYVKTIDAEKNTVTVGQKPDIYSRGLVADNINYVSVEKLESGQRAEFRIRHTPDMIAGIVEVVEDGRLRIKFDEPQWAVAPGQAIGIYSGDAVLAGGIIEQGCD